MSHRSFSFPVLTIPTARELFFFFTGDEVKFSPELVEEGFLLANKGEKLMDSVYLIDDMDMSTIRGMESRPPPERAITIQRLRNAIQDFEAMYRVSEQNYIEALIKVEKQSRSLVQTTADLITKLTQKGKLFPNQELLNLLGQLDRKSRDKLPKDKDFDMSIMEQVLNQRYKNTMHEKLWYLGSQFLELSTY